MSCPSGPRRSLNKRRDDGKYDGYAIISSLNGTSFSYTGEPQSYTINQTGIYQIECWGAKGGYSYGTDGENGGYTSGMMTLQKGDVLYIYVGGKGGTERGGGFNGGGRPGHSGSGGGGATHVATIGGQLWTLGDVGTNQIDKHDRREFVIMAAGGGGGGDNGKGGCAGGLVGRGGADGATGGSQTAPGEGNARDYDADNKLPASFGRGGYGFSGDHKETITVTVNGVSVTGVRGVVLAQPGIGVTVTKAGDWGWGDPATGDWGSGGGGGWYGGGGAYASNGGGGGSSHVNEAFYFPSTSANGARKVEVSNMQNIAGDEEMPSPSGATEIGHAGAGAVRLTFVAELERMD